MKTYLHTLYSGRNILVDIEDKDILFKYILNTMQSATGYTRYVVCKDLRTRKYAGLLHRLILNASSDVMIDHENGNGLDCTKNNLRICTNTENQQNRRITKIENEVKGLFFRKDRGYWVAKIVVNKRQIVLGSFANKEDAIKIRLAAEKFYFGEFNGLGTMNNTEFET